MYGPGEWKVMELGMATKNPEPKWKIKQGIRQNEMQKRVASAVKYVESKERLESNGDISERGLKKR